MKSPKKISLKQANLIYIRLRESARDSFLDHADWDVLEYLTAEEAKLYKKVVRILDAHYHD